jgi:hypothetical protein
MAIKYYTGIDLNGNNLTNVRLIESGLENRINDPAELDSFEGRFYFNTTDKKLKIYDGTNWVDASPDLDVEVVQYRGPVDPVTAGPPVAETGDLYISSAAGTIDAGWTGVAGELIESGDFLIYDGANWAIIQTNIIEATEGDKGIVRYATEAEVNAGTDDDSVVRPVTLTSWREDKTLASVYNVTIATLDADTATDVDHNLDTENISVVAYDENNEQIVLKVVVIDENKITVTSNVELTDVRVVVQGF